MVRFRASARELSRIQNAQIDPGAHPLSYPIGTLGNFPWDKRAGRESDL